MATIYDIAKHCGISAATVSYVLSGQGQARRISAATQQKVFDAAHELGYDKFHPQRQGNPLITIYWRQHHMEMTMPPLINGINNVLATEISPVDVAIRPFQEGYLSDQHSLWQAGSSDAAIILGTSASDLAYLQEHQTKVPTILFNRDLPGYSSVTIDHVEAGTLAAQHAINKGGKSLALVLDTSELYGLANRGKAILDVCRDNGIDMRSNLFYCNSGIDAGYEMGWEMIRKNQLRKVIICVNDMVALGIISALGEAGIKVGEEAQVIATSTGLSRLFARTNPPLTVVDLKMEELSARALKMAIQLGTQRISSPQKVLAHPIIIYRQSCPRGDINILN